ncbi:MAG: alpha-L-glutamate ligase-like protein [Candidatus Methylomirabilales bacterium]
MNFATFRQLRRTGVLGMNRRNAEYIMRCNPRQAFPLVDDKVRTKRLAESHGVPTPPLYLVIEHHGDISGLSTALGDLREFVVKPARGAGGSGIVLIVDRNSEGFVKASGHVTTLEDLAYHISGILSGIYSLAGLPDRAIVEGLIHPDPVFATVTYRGVPDIRIVVYRRVPVMAMVRLPTRASDGKANIHRGALGAGIDIGTGTTLTAVHRSDVVTHHPDTGNTVSGIQVPYWERILLMAARAPDMAGLDYVGVDVVIDRDRGPVLLELNARPGLAVQVANRGGLWGRLEQIDKAPPDTFATPETRVAWAEQTFTTSHS